MKMKRVSLTNGSTTYFDIEISEDDFNTLQSKYFDLIDGDRIDISVPDLSYYSDIVTTFLMYDTNKAMKTIIVICLQHIIVDRYRNAIKPEDFPKNYKKFRSRK